MLGSNELVLSANIHLCILTSCQNKELWIKVIFVKDFDDVSKICEYGHVPSNTLFVFVDKTLFKVLSNILFFYLALYWG